MTMSTTRPAIAALATALFAASLLVFGCGSPRGAEPQVATPQVATLQVVCSGGFSAALRELAPQFERSSGTKLVIGAGPSMGTTPNAIPVRLQRGERLDVVIMVGSALDALIAQGKVMPTSRVDLARSAIGVVVRKGAAKPDIRTAESVKRALLDAASIAYSDSASGVYISTEMFQRLGIADQVKAKAHMIPAEPVAAVVARGEAELGFQQLSELMPVPGVEIVGPLPPELQKITVFAAGVVTGSSAPDAATALLRFLSSPAATAAVTRSGLTPIAPAGAP
jgi:molybdate transport system substrate-binding protein